MKMSEKFKFSFLPYLRRHKFLSIILLSVLLLVMVTFFYFIKNYLEDSATEPISVHYPAIDSRTNSRYQIAEQIVNYYYNPASYIRDCKIFPNNISDMHNNDVKINNIKCIPYTTYKVEEPELSFEIKEPWIDPWGRPYQIKYDYDEETVSVRSQGRYTWTTLDDIVREIPFFGKSYPKHGDSFYLNMIEHCEKVTKDDMTCIFNRGWH